MTNSAPRAKLSGQRSMGPRSWQRSLLCDPRHQRQRDVRLERWPAQDGVPAPVVGTVAIFGRSTVENVEIASSHHELEPLAGSEERAGRPDLDVQCHGLTGPYRRLRL